MIQVRALVALAVMLVGSVASAQQGGWYTSLEEAREAARVSGRPLLIHFHAWYCGPCRQMESQVFHHADVQGALTQGLVAVQIDVTQDPDAASQYGATTVPRDVVVYPDTKVETINVGFVPRLSYITLLRDVARRGEVFVRTPDPVTTSDLVVEATNDDAAAADHQEPLLGLEGYCPVRLLKSREWIAGSTDLQEEYRGVIYRFSDAAARDEFLSEPSRFSPQVLGCDPVVLAESQRAVPGSIRFGAFFDDRLYLFASAQNKAEFKTNPLKFTRIRAAVRREQIQGVSFR